VTTPIKSTVLLIIVVLSSSAQIFPEINSELSSRESWQETVSSSKGPGVLSLAVGLQQNDSITIQGQVLVIACRLEASLIFSYVTVLVTQVVVGPTALHGTEIVIKHVGGEVNGTLLWVSDQPYFFVGENFEISLRQEGNVYVPISPKETVAKPLGPLATTAGYVLEWYKPAVGWQTSTTRPGLDWYGPFKWSSGTFDYWINTNGIPSGLSSSSFISYATAGFQTWQDDPNSAIAFNYRGTRTDVNAGSSDGINVVGWSYLGGSTIAEAYGWAQYTFGIYDSLRFTETDMIFDNSKLWSAQSTGVTGRFDVQNIGTHEAGHTFGLGDLYDPSDSEETMYGYAALGETKKRTLEWGDLAGVAALYPNPIVQITVTSSPTGSSFVIVDSTPISTPQTFSWVIGSTHTLTATISMFELPEGIGYVWTSWSDGGAVSHSIVASPTTTTYTANFKTQYQLTISVSPSGGGSTDPAVGSYWYDSGASVSVSETAGGGYSFYYWSLDGTNVGTSSSYSVLMNSAHTLTAFFRSTSSLSLGVSPASISLGSSATVSGVITPTQPSPGIQAGTSVLLAYSSDGGNNWSVFVITQTDGSGTYSVVWFPPYSGTYQLKASWAGNENYAGATSTAATLTVTGSRPPQISLLVSGPRTATKGTSVTFDVLVANPDGSGVTTTLYIEVSGPAGYYYFDTLQVTLAAGATGRFQLTWQVPSGLQTGDYRVVVGLIPPTPASVGQTLITIT